jgi:hypothetical protein
VFVIQCVFVDGRELSSLADEEMVDCTKLIMLHYPVGKVCIMRQREGARGYTAANNVFTDENGAPYQVRRGIQIDKNFLMYESLTSSCIRSPHGFIFCYD